MPPAYRLQQVTVDRDGRRVLDLGEVEVPSGRVTALVGPNGAGKTTLLKLLALLLPPTSGTIAFQGVPLPERQPALRALRQQVTLVAHAPLLFHRTVSANVAYGLGVRGRAEPERVEAALAAVGLTGFGERPAWKLSGGESQRVAIARALAIDPPVLLFDEPTANIDHQHVAIIETLIGELGRRGKTVILTTHNLDQAYRLSDEVRSLVAGRVAAAPRLNVLRGVTTQHDGESYFESGALRIEMPAGAMPHTIAIDPEDIIVSREPLHSSARNCLAGHILKVENDGRGVVFTVDCGQPLIARITRHSYDEMALNLGTHVWLTFKSSAIHALDEPAAHA